MIYFKRSTLPRFLFSVHEADDANADNGAVATDNNSEDNNQDSNNDDNGDNGSNEDFDIDTNLNDDTSDESSDSSSDDSTSSSSSSSSSSDINTAGDADTGDENTDEDVVKTNSDIFATLSAEEQQIKIKELKRTFNDLYIYCDDVLNKLNYVEQDENNIDILSRITLTMYSIKQYLKDYIVISFPLKSYVENDIAYNRFLSMLNSVSNIVEEIAKIKAENIGKSEKKS